MTGNNKRGMRDARGRFRKGYGGSRKGRPRNPPRAAESSFDVVLDEKVTVAQGGMDQQLSFDEAMRLRTLEDAFAGVRSAEREVLRWIEERENAIAAREARQQKLTSIDHKFTHDPSNADSALQLLGIAAPVDFLGDYRLRLTTWSVQMALSRRRGGLGLTDREISEIKRCTDAPASLRWPRRYRNDD